MCSPNWDMPNGPNGLVSYSPLTTKPPPSPKAVYPSAEPPAALTAAAAWRAALSSRHRCRHFTTHQLAMTGQLVALDRWCQPMHPPQQLVHGQ